MQYIEQWGALGVFIASVSDERMLVDLENLANTALTQWGGWGSNPRPTDYEFGVDDWE